MSDIKTLAGITGAGVALNATYHISNKQDPVPSIIAGVVFFGLLAGIGAASGRYDFVKIIAGVSLLGVVLLRGAGVITLINKFLVGVQTAPTKQK
jgi:hypothetical protein